MFWLILERKVSAGFIFDDRCDNLSFDNFVCVVFWLILETFFCCRLFSVTFFFVFLDPGLARGTFLLLLLLHLPLTKKLNLQGFCCRVFVGSLICRVSVAGFLLEA